MSPGVLFQMASKEVTMKQVPEREEQLRWLKDKLAVSKAFDACRGGFGGIVCGLARRAESPSAFCREWDTLSGQLRVLGNLLATLKRDGWEDACHALETCLAGKMLLPGESVDEAKTEPITILIPSVDKVFALIRWLLIGSWEELVPVSQAKASGHTQKLLDEFPDLRTHLMRAESSRWDSRSVAYVLREEIDLVMKKSLQEIFGKISGVSDNIVSLRLGSQTTPNFYDGCLALVIFADQKDVLRRIPRSEQKDVATWTFRRPKVQGLPFLEVGFFGEDNYPNWKEQHPALVSRGVSRGFRAILIDGLLNFKEFWQGEEDSRRGVLPVFRLQS